MFLLDTNVVSELRKIGSRRADPQVTAWAQSVDANLMFLSCVFPILGRRMMPLSALPRWCIN